MTIEQMVEELPPDLRAEVMKFIQSLLERRKRRIRRKPTFKWEGALRDLRDTYTSVELQHQIARWRAGVK